MFYVEQIKRCRRDFLYDLGVALVRPHLANRAANPVFYDGLGVTNPLRGHSTLHNVGVFFYTIKNIPHRFNSCFANVHLLALCYAEDLKKYGFGPVLEKFVAEMNVLSKSGFVGTCPVIGEQTIYASLCQVTCDNLALNGILGFIEFFM